MPELESLIKETKMRLLRMHFESRCGHIGGNLSCLDILMTLFHVVMQSSDEFVLSKGHAAGALYSTLWSRGLLSDDDLKTFHKDGTKLAGHPAPAHLPQIPFATGSLGHGLGLSSGLALARQLRGEPGRVYCLLSDGEWQEGSNWEALIFAAHRKLPLTLIVDRNRLQGFGFTSEIAGSGNFVEQFTAFGVPAIDVDGHDIAALRDALCQDASGVRAIIANTNKGNGVSFMCDQMKWHYLPLSAEQYELAIQEIAAT